MASGLLWCVAMIRGIHDTSEIFCNEDTVKSELSLKQFIAFFNQLIQILSHAAPIFDISK